LTGVLGGDFLGGILADLCGGRLTPVGKFRSQVQSISIQRMTRRQLSGISL
jgi:hypothetical protein